MNYGTYPFSQFTNDFIEFLLKAFNLAVLVAIILIVICIVIVATKKKKDLNDCGLDITIRNDVSGIVFGKKNSLFYVASNEAREGHVICLGPSGTGKTSALLIPTLNNWRGTSFTIDISGDIISNIRSDNKIVYEPENISTVPYDIFYAVDILPTISEKNLALEKIAFALLPELAPHETSAGAKYYNDGGRDVLIASLIAFYHEGMDFIDICNKILSLDYKKLFDEIDKSRNDIAIKYINSFEGALPEHIAGCKGEANKAIKIFVTNSFISGSIRRPKDNEYCINVESVEKYNVFLNIEDSKLEVYAPLIRIIITLQLKYFSTRGIADKNILLCIDELASFGRLDLTESLRKLRKNRVRIFCLTQSLADIEMIYGILETKAMLNNFAFKVILGATDTATQEYFSKLIGHKKGIKRSVQKNGVRKSITESESKEYAIEPEDLARLKKHLVLIYQGGFMKLRKNYYFKK